MVELTEHKAYELLAAKYDRVCLDYVILLSDEEYRGVETHKEAVIEAFRILNERFAEFDYQIDIRTDKMTAEISSISELLEVPPEEYCYGRVKRDRHFTVQKPIPYWYAFLNPPQGTPYRCSDFIEFNDLLFPDKECVEVYRWNDDFSNYFDAGTEWWGTGLWTVASIKTGLIVVIGASLTD